MTDSERELKVLTNKRGQVKAKLTRFNTFFDNPNNQQNIAELEVRFAKLDDILTTFENLQEQIEVLDETTDHATEREEFETQYFNLFAKVKKHIKENATQNETHSHSSTHSQSSAINNNAISIKLPTINLPSFSGKYEEWMSYFDTFNALIDKNDSLTEVQKLHYLKASLTGEAAKTLDNLDLTSPNYSIAISFLKNQYQNERLIVHNHVKALFNLPQLQRDSPLVLKQFINSIFTHMRALKCLKQPTESWDTLIVHLITTKLDTATLRDWELSTKPTELPSLNELTDFLQKRCQIFENIHENRPSQPHQYNKVSNVPLKPTSSQNYKTKAHLTVAEQKCKLCNGNHAVFHCSDLLNSTHENKIKMLSTARICFNCLHQGHRVDHCRSSGCKKCGRKHNTLLHIDYKSSGLQPTSEPKSQVTKSLGTCEVSNTDSKAEVLLSTALVDIVSPLGKQLTCRAFLDSGSQSNFISETVCQSLQLKKERSSLVVTGIGEGATHVSSKVKATVKSLTSNHAIETEFLVLPKITGLLPTSPINTTSWPIPQNITLADPSFSRPGKIDILLGQEHFFDLLEHGSIKIKNLPTLQNTKVGWVVGGKSPNSSRLSTTCHVNVMERIDQQLQDFWKIEEINSNKTQMSQEENACEEHYADSVYRTENGRYIVTMPLKDDPHKLGESQNIAQKRFHQVEKRFKRQPDLKEQYIEFMREYEQLGHMERVNTNDAATNDYYLPHHPVVKESSSTTKLRVVFDASAKTSTNMSLNDILMVGPTIQDDLFSILLRFRVHIYVITADIEKMYRQIWIDPKQSNLLKILWRENPNNELQTFQLNTVTYGTACAPYLAIKTLQQLAIDERNDFPDAAAVIMKDFYVDDLLTGTDSLDDGIKLQHELIQLLHRGGFNLRKWNANHNDLLQNVSTNLKERHPQELAASNETTTKTLGLLWNSCDDTLQFTYHIDSTASQEVTKRIILSQIAKLFDPLGLVSPIVIRAKIFLQELWKTKLDWDDKLPEDLKNRWLNFKHCLISLNNVHISRSTVTKQPGGILEVHGFSDASEQAYGGAVYIKYATEDSNSQVRLLCSKSRVSPLKTISLPRLELCGALLLAELMSQVQKALGNKISKMFFWTDSSIVLSWLSSEASRWKTFVANRVAKIHDLSNPTDWKHVRSEENPADLVSRGTRTEDLIKSSLWWNGPRWLADNASEWPSTFDKPNQEGVIHEEKRKKEYSAAAVVDKDKSYITDIIQKFSSLQKLQRVVAFCARFAYNCRHPHTKRTGPLTPNELSSALERLIQAEQWHFFNAELLCLTANRSLPGKSKLVSLNPFIDARGMVRVGGRLDHSNIKYNHKHPIFLPKKSHLTHLIARNEHIRHLHAGPQALLAAIRQQFWPLGGSTDTRIRSGRGHKQ